MNIRSLENIRILYLIYDGTEVMNENMEIEMEKDLEEENKGKSYYSLM